MTEESRECDLWMRIREDMRLRGGVGAYAMENFISPLRLLEDTGEKLILEYPSSIPLVWVEMNYLSRITEAVANVLQSPREIELVEASPTTLSTTDDAEPELPLEFAAEESPAPVQPKPAPRKRRSPRKETHFNSGLNEDCTFDSFIVGENSRFAYLAALSFAENPEQSHNPLFIHGASGLGKTHLLQAIGNAIRSRNEDVRVLYVTAEEFTNGYIEALDRKGEALSSFRRKYRKADVLLVDDIQFFAKKEKMQDEFFHTFNSLSSSGKLIVLGADCPAADMVGLSPRLTSRFEQGLSVSLEAPAYETRMDILRSKNKKWKAGLVGDDVMDFLARNITRSVRRLEGALTRLASFASFSNRRPTVADARMQIKDFLNDDTADVITIKDIQQCVADEFNLRVADLNGRRRTANIAHPRQIAMFIARHHTACSLQDIGAAFGGRDHGTVIHATRTIRLKMESDSDLRATINRMLVTLGA